MSVPYREFAPPSDLARLVDCFWTIRVRVPVGESASQLVLPDGCMDIIFSLSGDSEGATAVGTMTRPLPVDVEGDIHLFGVRFRPAGAGPFLPAPADRLTDRVVALDDLWSGGVEELLDRLASARSDAERVHALSRALRERLSATELSIDRSVLTASEVVAAARGTTKVDALASTTGLSRRQLERRFLASVGIGPKLACRVARFREVVAHLHGPASGSLSRIALETGYADQAHMSRDFKAFAGISPGAYRRAIDVG